MFKIPLVIALLAGLGLVGPKLVDRYSDHEPARSTIQAPRERISQAQYGSYDPTPNYSSDPTAKHDRFDGKRKKHRRFDPTPNVKPYDPSPRSSWWFESWFEQHPTSFWSRWFYKLGGDRKEDVRDRIENKRDRHENATDKKENFRDRKEDVRDRKEDVRDAQTNNGRRDRLEDRRDNREDVLDNKEDVRDQRENVKDRRENGRDRSENRFD